MVRETPEILKFKSEYIVEYPQAIKFAEMQSDVFWTDKEIVLDKDLVDLHNNLTEAELHGVTTVLKLFTEYELRVGRDFWLDTMMKIFHRPELHRMFATFGMAELNIHAPFYAKINELLGLATNEFYNEYVKDKTLKSRIESIDKAVSLPENPSLLDKLRVIASASIIEGAILYSNFAFLKHFQAEGKSKLINLVAGINFSVRDENIHSLAGSWLFRTLSDEARLTLDELNKLVNFIYDFVYKVREHEHRIIDMIFERGPIKGITDHQLKNFVDHRLNLCLSNLDMPNNFYEVEYNPIAKWFYKSLQLSELHDFFAKQGKEYNRNWKKTRFVWA